MPEPAPTATDRQALVDHYITKFSRLARQHCPTADIVVLAAPYEDEDARIVVMFPKEVEEHEMDRLSALLTQRSTALLLDTGLLILVGVYEASEHPQCK